MTGQALIVQGDALRLPLPDRSVDAIVCDPPYGLEFMGKDWDSFRYSNSGPQHKDFKNLGKLPTYGPNRRNQKCPDCGKWRYDHPGRICECGGWKQPARLGYSRAYQAWCEQWATDALRVLRPGGWLLAFGGTRTWHRLACGIEDAGFEKRDTVLWLHGSGFPKSLDVDRAIDMHLCQLPGRHYARGLPPEFKRRPDDHVCPDTPEGSEWAGYGSAFKPAWEPVIVARKPLAGSVAQNVLTFGTGALNIDAARIRTADKLAHPFNEAGNEVYGKFQRFGNPVEPSGRWPPNVALVHSAGCQPTGTRKIRNDGSGDVRGTEPTAAGFTNVYGEFKDDGRQFQRYADADGMEEITAWTCEEDCPVALLDQQSGESVSSGGSGATSGTLGLLGGSHGYTRAPNGGANAGGLKDRGGASRFFYTAKAGPNERVTIDGEGHPTVKPLSLMRWLVRLVCPPGGLILDPFAGSGTTGEAAMLEGFRSILIDKDPANLSSIRVRTHPYVRRTKVVTNGHRTGPEQGSLL